MAKAPKKVPRNYKGNVIADGSVVQNGNKSSLGTTTGRAAKISDRDARVKVKRDKKTGASTLVGRTSEAKERLSSSMGSSMYYFEDSKGKTWYTEPLEIKNAKGESVGASALRKAINRAGKG